MPTINCAALIPLLSPCILRRVSQSISATPLKNLTKTPLKISKTNSKQVIVNIIYFLNYLLNIFFNYLNCLIFYFVMFYTFLFSFNIKLPKKERPTKRIFMLEKKLNLLKKIPYFFYTQDNYLTKKHNKIKYYYNYYYFL